MVCEPNPASLKSDCKKLPWQTSVEEWLQKAALADISWRVTTKSCLGRHQLKSDYKKLPWQTSVEEWLQKAALADISWRVTTKSCLGRHWLKSDYKKLPLQTLVEEWLQKAALADIGWRVTTKSCLGKRWFDTLAWPGGHRLQFLHSIVRFYGWLDLVTNFGDELDFIPSEQDNTELKVCLFSVETRRKWQCFLEWFITHQGTSDMIGELIKCVY